MPRYYYTRQSKSHPNSNTIFDYLLTVYDTRSGRAKRLFCTDTFRMTIREWHARDFYATIDDVTIPYEPLFVTVNHIRNRRVLLRRMV